MINEYLTMKVIPLTKGKFAKVDDEDYDYLNQFKWCFLDKGCGYARRTSYLGSLQAGSILMHRVIMNAPKGMEVDHINGDGLDNRKINFRIVTHSINTKNRTRVNKNNTSKHLGIHWHKRDKRWQVNIGKDYHRYYFGSYKSKKEAILVAKRERQRLFNLQNT